MVFSDISFTAFATVIRNYILQLKEKVTAYNEDGC